MKPAADEIDRHVGAKLRFLRESKGFTQAYVAKKVGVTFQQIQKYEQGTNRISASRLWQFCDVFDVAPNDFFSEWSDRPLQDQNRIPRKVAETAWQLHQLQNANIRNQVMELIKLCK